jgi:hypothetical protein
MRTVMLIALSSSLLGGPIAVGQSASVVGDGADESARQRFGDED